jgi:hypothetical protein
VDPDPVPPLILESGSALEGKAGSGSALMSNSEALEAQHEAVEDHIRS